MSGAMEGTQGDSVRVRGDMEGTVGEHGHGRQWEGTWRDMGGTVEEDRRGQFGIEGGTQVGTVGVTWVDTGMMGGDMRGQCEVEVGIWRGECGGHGDVEGTVGGKGLGGTTEGLGS